METMVLRDLASLRSLEQEWPAQSPPAPFYGWRTVLACLEADEVEPFVVLVCEGGRCLAAAPWCIMRDHGGMRCLTGIGGEDSWYHDPWILRPERDAAIAVALVDALRTERKSWDLVRLDLREARSAPLIRELGKVGVGVAERIDWMQHPTLALGDDWETYWSARPKETREFVRKKQRKIAALAPRYVEADAQNLDAMLQALFRLHGSRWEGERAWSGYHHAIRTMAEEALQRGELCFYSLDIEEQPIAFQLLVREGACAYEIIRVFDPEPRFASFSPGTLLMVWVYEHMMKAGVREVDLGPGQSRWKSMYETHRTETVRLSVALPSRLPALAHVTWQGIVKPYLRKAPALKRLKAAFGKASARKQQGPPMPVGAQHQKA